MTDDDAPVPELPTPRRQRPDDVATPALKKVRLDFSVKDFRNRLKTDQRTVVLHRFAQLLENNVENCVTYLEQGGTVMEILQSMEGDSGASPLLVFDIVNRVLLQIGTKLLKYQNTAYDACRYLLNTYLFQINKMLGLSSSMKERIVVLKLLTTMVTCSPFLGKEILLNVALHPTNLELLTNLKEGKNEARGAFIHFITAYLVDGQFTTFSVLLEKHELLTSIISGLQYDDADVVVLVITAMKNHILENSLVSKTIKMRTFSTPVVKNIVNLYNWRGPSGYRNPNKPDKTGPVDEIGKSKVSEAVHAFLLVLCTSHKFGIIFKDPLIGIGQCQNNLVYTVLDSLVRPWEHSYASDLVIKICKVCPDLVRTVWNKMKVSLDPRYTPQWLKTVEFAEKLLDELQPRCFEFAVDTLTSQQLGQVITSLTSPTNTLKVLIPNQFIFDIPKTKYHVLKLLLKMLISTDAFVQQVKSWPVDSSIIQNIITNHIRRNFPKLNHLLKDWDESDEDLYISQYLDVAFDLLAKYKILASKVFDLVDFDLKAFILKSGEFPEDSRLRLQVKALEIFLDHDPFLFKPKTDLFRKMLVACTEYYYSSKDPKVHAVLKNLLQNCGIFDTCLSEIDFWIDGFLNLKSFDAKVAESLCDNILKAEGNTEQRRLFEAEANFSPLVLNLDAPKCAKNYLNFVLISIFHVQNDPGLFVDTVPKYKFLPEAVKNYFSSPEVSVLPRCKGKLMEKLHDFSSKFLEATLDNFEFDLYPNQELNTLQALVFYLSNLVKTGALAETHKANASKFINFLSFEDDRCIKTILRSPEFLRNFTILSSEDGFITKLIMDVVKSLKPERIASGLVDFRSRVVSILSKLFRKPEKYKDVVISTETIEIIGLDYRDCHKLLSKFVDNKMFYPVASYCLNRMSELGKEYKLEPLSNDIVKELSLLELALPLHNYLKVFPHNIQGVDSKLFETLVLAPEFNKDNLALAEFLLDRKPECLSIFEHHLDEICSKRSFILSLLDVVLRKYQDQEVLEKIFAKIENHIVKALQKPHKAGQHFQNRHESLGVFVEKFMKLGDYGKSVQKFETTEFFHVYLLNKIYNKIEKTEKVWSNMVMTFVHLVTNFLKQKKEGDVSQIGEVFLEFLLQNKGKYNGASLATNETLKTFSKLCLKFGVSGDVVLLRILSEFAEECFGEEDSKLVLEMLFSHSQFLEVALGDSSKVDLIGLWKTICTKWPDLMERGHVPVLLASYRGTKAEINTLSLIKMYESRSTQTKFFDFKPFLWGRAAALHYSVRSDPQKALWRQPKISDVLNNLHSSIVSSTITDPSSPTSYDLDFFLPLFTHLLAAENPVPTYRFTKSGALALTLTGFRGDKNQRLASCTVLQRFHFHLEARQSGKDNLVWLRLIEAVCKGVAVLDDFKINDFVGVFWARTAMIMTQPTDVMYLPLSQYLAAKDSLHFDGIPELYTFLHSPHVDSWKHKRFILEVLRDGLKNEKDFTTLLKSMGFKLISELCSSTVCDVHTKVVILEIFEKCCETDLGIKVLCGSLSFLTQITSLVQENITEAVVLVKILRILLKIIEPDTDRHRNFLIYFSLISLSEDQNLFQNLIDCKCLYIYYKILRIIVGRFPDLCTLQQMQKLLDNSKDDFCKYMVQYGCQYLKASDISGDLGLLFYSKLKMSYASI